jgi:AmmeMemoRadiSam system protein B
MEYYKLRTDIDIFPTDVSGEPAFCIRDPINLADRMFFVPPPTLFIISLFNGRNPFLDIQAVFKQKYGVLVPEDKLKELAHNFDKNFFMDNERYRAQKLKKEEEFKKSPVRKAILAGRSYEPEPEKLKQQIDQYFKAIGKPDSFNKEKRSESLKGIIAPHIDFSRGEPCYAWAYKKIMESEPADIYLIFGTSHAPSKSPFILCRKKFLTPFGELEVDQEFVDIMEAECSYSLFDDEKNHQNEHSIEFQLIFLQYLLEGKKDIKIVPVLCSSFHNIVTNGESPLFNSQIVEFIKAVKKAISSTKKKIFMIASADLAHIGHQFGDNFKIDHSIMSWVEKEDLAMLKTLEDFNLNGFYNSVYHDGDKRKICGFPPIFTMLQVMDSGIGKLLKYEKWVDTRGEAAVTFAGMAFYDK